MKSKTKWVLTPVLAISLIFALSACVNQDVKTLGRGTDLLSLSIGDTPVKLVDDPATEMKEGKPDPINTNEWERDDFVLYGADFGWIAFKESKDLVLQRVRATVSKGALAEWGVGTRATRPGYFSDNRVPMSFESDEYIYIKVTSEDKEVVSYYRFYTKLLSTVNELASIATGKRIAKAEGVPAGTWDEAQEDVFSITTDEATNAEIEATTFDPNATVQFAGVTGDTTDPTASFQPSSVRITLADQDLLYVKVTAENTVDSAFYKFRVNVGRMATIERLFFKDEAVTYEEESPNGDEIFGKGLASGTWASVGPGSYETADPAPAGYVITINPDDPDATYEYARIEDTGAPAPATFTYNKTTPGKVGFTDSGQALAIKVTAKNKDNAGKDIVMYYKIKVDLLAAKIKTHPKSAWYMRGAPAVALTVELDRPGNFEYQWYEADSLYGFYGRHGMDLDEKNNVSFVNGGPSMYFYLVEPDSTDTNSNEIWAWSLPGETTDSYTPATDWEDVFPIETVPGSEKKPVPIPHTSHQINFVTGSTSEVRYYWVKVTNPQNGRFVISERAVILTETDPTMNHFIFDLSVLPNKNIIPFTTKKNDPYYGDDPYKIDLKAYMKDLNLDPSKFEICVAQAQYFLPDGRAWTQNWTHGDLHFGYDEGSTKGALTWWHNNLGANSGAIPLQSPHSSQGGLSEKPDWVGFKPSGDPDKDIPRNYATSSNGQPTADTTGGLPKGTYSGSAYPAEVAQGYFCGFSKLMELRFATAPGN
jgi:hypothetical protein